MQIVGITGNSGSGKSIVAKIIQEEYGAKIIDADKIARELLEEKTDYYKEIVDNFGNTILENENICRQKLAQIIYNNKIELEKLNTITNKHVVKKIEQEIANSKVKIVVIDVPLLFESNLDKRCNIVIAVIADFEKKVERICRRDKISEQVAIQRLSIQAEDNYYKQKTKNIIQNNNDEETLKKEIINVLKLGGFRTSVQKL